MSNNTNRITGSFTGTIDELLSHCCTIEPETTQPKTLNEEELPQEILDFMRENNMSQTELLEFAKEQMIQQELDNLIEEGKVEIIGYTPTGDPIYKATEA